MSIKWIITDKQVHHLFHLWRNREMENATLENYAKTTRANLLDTIMTRS